MDLVPTGEGDIVEQLNAAAARHGLGWPITIAVVLVGVFTMPFGLLIWLLGVPLCWWLFQRDRSNRAVVLFYDVHDESAAWFDTFVTDWAGLTGCARLWRTIQSGRTITTQQRKVHSGAGQVVNRVPVNATIAGPKHLKTNIVVPSLQAGRSSIYFLPDRVLVREGKRYTDVSYQHLRASGQPSQFIEAAGTHLPRDAQKVGQTWQYVNVHGGPDRRYKKNPVRPIALYGQLNLTTTEGLEWRLDTSQPTPPAAVITTLTNWQPPAAATQPPDVASATAKTCQPSPNDPAVHPALSRPPEPLHAPALLPDSRVGVPGPSERQPLSLTTTEAVEPWAKPEWPPVDVAGVAHYKENARQIFKLSGGRSLSEGPNDLDLSASLQPDPANEYDEHAVAVFMRGVHVGFLPRGLSAAYIPALDELADDGKHLTLPGRLRIYHRESFDDPGTSNIYVYASVRLPPVSGVQSFNDFPDEPYAVLPRGKKTRVTEEEEHMNVLGQYVGNAARYVAVTLHEIERQKTPRSQKVALVEIRLDGEPIGVLTKTMSQQFVDVIRFINSKNLVPVARGQLAGSPLRVEVSLDAAKSSEISRQWMDSLT